MKITQLLDQDKCCGCTSCVAVCPKQCISMIEDVKGFLYPSVDSESCVDCGKCEKVCPALNINDEKIPQKVWAVKNRDEMVRFNSSSGGVFMALAEWIIEKGGVVFGARFDDDWSVVHDYAETIEDVQAFRGSKYLQSKMNNCYSEAKRFLDNDRWVLFTGTQCQISGLKKYLGKEYERLLAVDVICHGVPSPLVWKDYLKFIRQRQLTVDGKNTVCSSLNELPLIDGIAFRDKSKGWKKFGLAFRFRQPEGMAENSVWPSVKAGKVLEWTSIASLHEDIFMQGFLRNFYLRPSCYCCPSKAGRSQSDITLGDYWGLPDELKSWDDDRGISLVLVYSEKGSSVLEELNVEKKLTTYEKGLKSNLNIANSVGWPRVTTKFWSMYPQHKTETIERCVKMMEPSIIHRILRKMYRMVKR